MTPSSIQTHLCLTFASLAVNLHFPTLVFGNSSHHHETFPFIIKAGDCTKLNDIVHDDFEVLFQPLFIYFITLNGDKICATCILANLNHLLKTNKFWNTNVPFYRLSWRKVNRKSTWESDSVLVCKTPHPRI